MSFEEGNRFERRHGGWVLVVGPSGAGKDTLIDLAKSELAGEDGVRFARRIVTRPQNAFEDHDTATADEFAAMLVAGDLVMTWAAHGLHYGIHRQWQHAAQDGAIVVANVSRTVVADAKARLDNVSVVLVTAPAHVLAARIKGRGRESAGPSRLARDLNGLVAADADLVIENTGTPADGARRLIDHLMRWARNPRPPAA